MTSSDMKNERPEVFAYLDYRVFMKDYLSHKRANNSQFSMRVFSRMCGFRSPNYISLILSEKRNLTLTNARRVAKACQLKQKEAKYFEALVNWNQADPFDKDSCFEELSRIQLSQRQVKLEGSKTTLMGKWYAYLVREMVHLPGFKAEASWISKRLNSRVSIEEAQQAIDLLLEEGFWHKDKFGNISQAEAVITSSHDQPSDLIRQYHRSAIQKSIEMIEGESVDRRDLRSMNLCLSKSGYQKVKEAMSRFQEEVVRIAMHDKSMDRVSQLNLQLLTYSAESEKESAS